MPSAKLWLGTLVVVCLLNGCAGGRTGRFINWYGTYKLEEELQLRVATHGMSQIEYVLIDTRSGNELFKDYSSDSGQWFFYWDRSRQRLWAHADKLGTAVWVSRDGYHFRKRILTKDSSFRHDIPQPVFDKLPGRTRRYLYQ